MIKSTKTRLFIIVCLLVVLCSTAVYATVEPSTQRTDMFRSTPEYGAVEITGINAVNFPHVLTYVTVNTPEGNEGRLTREDFQVFENNDLMEISSVSFPDKSSRTSLDLAILFDDTGSMSEEIADMKAKVTNLTDSLASAHIDCRYSLIRFNDAVSVTQEWTSDPAVIKNAVDSLEAKGGEDAPEVDLDAIEAALAIGFRPDAQHMILDITDSMTHYRGDGTPFSSYTIPETADHLLSNGTSYILVGPASESGTFTVHSDKKGLVKALGGSGLFIDIHSDDFEAILDRIESIITRTYTIGYRTRNSYTDGKKVQVQVVAGTHSDSGQFIMNDAKKTAASEGKGISDQVSGDKDAEKTGDETGTMSILGTHVLDITGINAINVPDIITYVIVNTTAGREGQLTRDDFEIYEEGRLMNISSFSFSDQDTPSTLDLAILFDDTGSLRDEIEDMKAKVSNLTEKIDAAGIDCRYALISFKDTVSVRQNWTADPVIIRDAVELMNASEGFDAPEADLDAIETALAMGFRPGAQHMILDITDSVTHYRDDGTSFSQYTIPETAGHLISNGTSYILVGPTTVTGSFDMHNDKRELVKALGGSGLFIDIHGDDFSIILDTIQGVITQTYSVGYVTPDRDVNTETRTVRVVSGSDEDSGQYSLRSS